ESLKNPKENFRVNSIGTFNILEAARKNKVMKVVFASSNAAVGEQTPPINESMVPAPLSPYGSTKLFGEALCSAYFNSYGLKTVSLRFANAYGPYSEHKTSVVAKFIRKAKASRSLEIYGDGKQTRDFIHARDICQAIYLCLTKSLLPCTASPRQSAGPWGQVFQIATGRETRVIDLAKFVQASLNASGKRGGRTVFSKARIGEIRKNYSDIRKARRLLGFKPRIRLKDGLKDLWHKGGWQCQT
ncbi:NAD-dependent epimerase/dehydratase family protein, partial [Candidatus Omnitrophota bacterium]